MEPHLPQVASPIVSHSQRQDEGDPASSATRSAWSASAAPCLVLPSVAPGSGTTDCENGDALEEREAEASAEEEEDNRRG
jgi:hypothetical protein